MVRISRCSLAAVADRLARGIDAAGQRRLRHDAAAPDRRDHVVLADHAVAVLDQIDQQVEHLRLDRDALALAMQFAPVDVEDVVFKEKLHVCAPHTVHSQPGSISEQIRPLSKRTDNGEAVLDAYGRVLNM